MRLADYGAIGAVAGFALAVLAWVIHAQQHTIRALVDRITGRPTPAPDPGDDNPPTDDTGE